MAGQGGAALPLSRHDVEDAIGEPRLLEYPGELKHSNRRMLTWLEHHRVPRCQGRRNLLDGDEHGVVPGRDLGADAYGDSLHVVHVRALEGGARALRGANEGGEVLKPLGKAAELGVHLAYGAAGLEGLCVSELWNARPEQTGGVVEDVRPVLHGHVLPDPGIEGFPGGLDGQVDLGRPRVRHGAQGGQPGRVGDCVGSPLFWLVSSAIDPASVVRRIRSRKQSGGGLAGKGQAGEAGE
mmetsp:Transcript_15489/g.30919  ORF Transcript_15489/g.30919 Transcript_15489/m.30919 type:complete len:239 (+) Transcript_15489:899-1615(+)